MPTTRLDAPQDGKVPCGDPTVAGKSDFARPRHLVGRLAAPTEFWWAGGEQSEVLDGAFEPAWPFERDDLDAKLIDQTLDDEWVLRHPVDLADQAQAVTA